MNHCVSAGQNATSHLETKCFYSLPYRSTRFTSTKEHSYCLAYLCFHSNKCCMMQQSCHKSPALSGSLQGGLVPLAGCCYSVGGTGIGRVSFALHNLFPLLFHSSHAVKQQGGTSCIETDYTDVGSGLSV